MNRNFLVPVFSRLIPFEACRFQQFLLVKRVANRNDDTVSSLVFDTGDFGKFVIRCLTGIGLSWSLGRSLWLLSGRCCRRTITGMINFPEQTLVGITANGKQGQTWLQGKFKKMKTQLFPCERDYLYETSGILPIELYLILQNARVNLTFYLRVENTNFNRRIYQNMVKVNLWLK